MDSLRRIRFCTSNYKNITGVMKSCVSVMKLITTVIKKFITEGVNSCRLESPFFGCSYLEKQYAQSHSNMLVMRGVQHIHLGQYVWEGVEHIQYPRLRLVAMELQAPERIRSHVHHVLLPWGFDEHSCARMNDNPVESVCDSVDTQVRQLVSDCEHLAHC